MESKREISHDQYSSNTRTILKKVLLRLILSNINHKKNLKNNKRKHRKNPNIFQHNYTTNNKSSHSSIPKQQINSKKINSPIKTAFINFIVQVFSKLSTNSVRISNWNLKLFICMCIFWIILWKQNQEEDCHWRIISWQVMHVF